MRAACFLVFAALATAQAPVPEVRGVITERGLNTPIAGAQVSLHRFGPNEENFISRLLVATTSTGPDGGFSFKPAPAGIFMVSAQKEGYSPAGDYTGEVTGAAPVQTVRLSLVRPGSLSGRVMDQDGKPLANFRLSMETVGERSERSTPAVTGADGSFTAANLVPGNYIVHIKPVWPALEELLPYTPEAFEIVDQEVEESYWPGGFPSSDLALPIPVGSGGNTNLGTLVVRKVPYYRVHVSLAGECAPNERWVFRIDTVPRSLRVDPEHLAGCQKEFLLTGLRPGPYQIALWAGRDVKAWAVVPFTIGNANIKSTLALSAPADLQVQLRAANGGDVAKLGPVFFPVRSADGIPGNRSFGEPDDRGALTIPNVTGRRQLISVVAEQAGTYVKEIRYNGLPLTSYWFDFIPGGLLEIVLDSGAATLAGTSSGPGYVLAIRDGIETTLPGEFPPFQFIGTTERLESGKFALGNLPPGTYRVLNLDSRTEFDWTAALARAEKVTLGPNETKKIDVKPETPAR